MTKKKLTYKNSIDQLETTIAKIESGKVSVDELADLVKNAANLIKGCKTKLRDTESELNQFLADSDE